MKNWRIRNRVIMTLLFRYLTALAIVLFFFEVGSYAQLNPVKWYIRANKPIKTLRAGDRVTVHLTASIENGWHIYSITQRSGGPIATRISLQPGTSFKSAGTIAGPKPKVKFDENFGINVESYEGTVVFNVPLRFTGANSSKLIISVRYQSCSGQTCLPSKTVSLTL
jgi:DsbC/DsbD-like thiol-disulfide interchange protein